MFKEWSDILKINDRYEIRIVVIEIKDSGRTGDVYNNLSEFKEDKPFSGYRYGFIVFDTETGSIPSDCNDWNYSVESALFDYECNVK